MRKNTAIIEISDNNIKLLQSKVQRGAVCLVHCDIQELDQKTDSHLADVLSRMVGVRKITSDETLLVIPRRHVMLKFVTLPTHVPQEIERMIQLQLTRLSPFSREEVICKYDVIEKTTNGYTDVLVVVVQKEVVERFLNVMQQAGVSCHKVVLASFGICYWLEHQQAGGYVKRDSCRMLIDVDQTTSELCICRRGKLIFSRNIPSGCKDLAQGNIAEFIQQIGLTLGTYRKEQGKEDISQILIVSEPSCSSPLKEAIEKYYSYPVSLHACTDDLPRDKNLKFPAHVAQGVSLTAGLGYILGSGEDDMSLIPEEIVDKKRIKRQHTIILRFIIMLIGTLLLGAASMGVGIYRKEVYLEKIENKISALKADVTKAQNKIKFLEFAKDERQNHIFLVDIVRELYQITPDSVSFRALGMDPQGRFEIQGYADTQAAINQLQNRLVGSSFFKDVTLQYATQRRILNQEFTEFKIVCQLQTGGGFDGR